MEPSVHIIFSQSSVTSLGKLLLTIVSHVYSVTITKDVFVTKVLGFFLGLGTFIFLN